MFVDRTLDREGMDAPAGAALVGATGQGDCLTQFRIDFTTGYGDGLRQHDTGKERYDGLPHSPSNFASLVYWSRCAETVFFGTPIASFPGRCLATAIPDNLALRTVA